MYIKVHSIIGDHKYIVFEHVLVRQKVEVQARTALSGPLIYSRSLTNKDTCSKQWCSVIVKVALSLAS